MSYDLHEPTFYDTATERWDAPDREAFDAPETAAGHYLLSSSGFPPESVDDLALPVVDAEGDLNRNALENAAHGPDSVGELDVDAGTARDVQRACHELLAEEFEETPHRVDDVRKELLAESEHRSEREHEVEQKQHTDDEKRELRAEETEDRHSAERPEKGQ